MTEHQEYHPSGNRDVKLALVMAGAALFASLLAMAAGFIANGNRIDEIQQSRRENLIENCNLGNRQNQAIIRFVLQISPESALRVKEAFPLVMSCQREAARRLR